MVDDTHRRLGPNISRVDARVRRFGPFGLMTDREHTDESAIAFVSNLVANVKAPPSAPEAIRNHLDALCELHRHGAFEYAFFAFVVTEAQLGLELTLGHLFLEHYPNGVPMVTPVGDVEDVASDTFDEVRRRLEAGYRLKGHPRFNGMLASLLDWGHQSGALAPWLERLWVRHGAAAGYYEVTRGEGTRVPETWATMSPDERGAWLEIEFRLIWERDVLKNEREFRNGLAHRTGPFVTSPIESARSINSLAEIVESLWDTPAPPESDSPPSKSDNA